MPESNSSNEPSVRKFWDRYINQLQKQGVKSKTLRWYVIRAEQYLKAFPDRKLADHKPDDVQAYLQKFGRAKGLQDWQYLQIVNAIQNLFQLVEVDWLTQVDWEFWKSSARSLSPEHPTIARDSSVSGGGPIRSESPANSVATARSQYKEVMIRLNTEIRRRCYSIRTEQAYEGWIARYIAFSGNRNPANMGA